MLTSEQIKWFETSVQTCVAEKQSSIAIHDFWSFVVFALRLVVKSTLTLITSNTSCEILCVYHSLYCRGSSVAVLRNKLV